MILVFFHSLLSLSRGSLVFFFAFWHKGGVMFISEVTDISPSNLDSSLCLIHPVFLIMYSAYKLNKHWEKKKNKQRDNIKP